MPSAELLVKQCLEGNALAYRQLYDRYCRAMYNTALRIVNRTADAEDVLQESFSDAFRELSTFENRSTFGAWLRQIVVNKGINFLKRKKVSFMDIEIAEEIADETDSIDEDGISYTTETIRQSIKQLPDGYRTVLSLYLLEGYDHQEISEILNVAQSTVRTQYIRARQKLLSLLKKKAIYEQS